jgi:hypothetical protein
MKPIGCYWKITCCRHMQTIFSTKVKTTNLTEERLLAFIRVLMSKYALSDNEILEQYIRIPFKPKKEYITIQRFQNVNGDELDISYYTQSSDISIDVSLSN